MITGPAKIVRGAGIVYTKDDIAANIVRNTFDIGTSAFGKVDERDLDAFVELTFTPEGRWDSDTLGFLWPYASTVAGASLLTASDVPTVITDSNAHVHTLPASCVTQMPSIVLSATKTMIGQATIMGARSDASDWEDPDELYDVALMGGTFADSGFSPSLIKTQPYQGVWGGGSAPTGFAAIDTEDGWTIDFDLQTTPIVTDRQGTLDFRFVSLGVMARCMPIGPSADQVVDASLTQGAGARRGRSLGSQALDLVISGDDMTTAVTLKSAGMKGAGFRFGSTVLRNGEVAFVATRTFSGGLPAALFTLA